MGRMRMFGVAVAIACLFSVSSAFMPGGTGGDTEMTSLYQEFDSATKEILSQMHPMEAAVEQQDSKMSHDADTEELEEEEEAPVTEILLDEKAHKAKVKASYQSNVKNIYFHLEEIIKKIIAHKVKWTKKYNGDLMKIAKQVLKHKKFAKKKAKKYAKAKGKSAAAKAVAKSKKKSFIKAKAKLKQKMKDATKAQKVLKGLYVKGLKNKAGEICMIRKIQCMVAKFNGQPKLQKKYCGACKSTAAKIKQWTVEADAIYVTFSGTFGSKKSKAFFAKKGCPQLAAVVDTLYKCATVGNTAVGYIKFKNVKQYQAVKTALPKSKKFKKLMKKFKKDGGTMTPWKLISFAQFHARDGTCTKVKPG